MTDARRSAPHVGRNTGPILEALRKTLPEQGLVLEVASGSGEQSAAFARAFPKLLWQPSDPDPAALASIQAWRDSEALLNLLPPVELDACLANWPIASAQAIVCINMVHISPWSATEGLMRGSERILPPGGILYLYGAYKENGIHTAPSNAVFDESLRARHLDWGVRDVADVTRLASTHGLVLVERIPMPANNLSLVFRRLA